MLLEVENSARRAIVTRELSMLNAFSIDGKALPRQHFPRTLPGTS
jgi:hypothetical protein